MNTGLTLFNKMAPFLIENATNQVDRITENMIQQAIQKGGKEIEK